jgi:hypothetical protein
VESVDDAVCLKTSPALGFISTTQYITVTNCNLASICNCFKCGTESSGDFRNITVSNCTFKNLPDRGSCSSGISLQSVDGSNIVGVVISNITMENMRSPIFLRLGNRGRAQTVPTPGSIENVSISHIVALGASLPTTISGIPNHYIRHVNISDLIVECTIPKLDKSENKTRMVPPSATDIEEFEGKYPDAGMFGILPIWGFFGRHVDDLKLVKVQFRTPTPENSNGLFLTDVHRVVVDGITLSENAQDESCCENENQNPIIWVNNSQSVTIHGYYLSTASIPIIRVSGSDCRNLSFLNNVNPSCDAQIEIDPEISSDEIMMK